MDTLVCASCTEGPAGEAGHGSLAFYVGGPFPGHNIYKCTRCDERWIRHYGSTVQPFAWTRYAKELRTYVLMSGRAPTRLKAPT